jgi:cell division protease FtsH
MGDEGFIGDFTVIPKEDISSNLKEKLNTQTMNILNSCLQKVNECIKNEWAIVDEIAQSLLKKEELDYDDINEIFAKYGKSKEKPEIDTNIIINSNQDAEISPNI